MPEQEGTRPFSMLPCRKNRKRAHLTLVSKVVEGLRGDTFLAARDIGHEALMKPKGLETLISRIRANVFPRATEEARELFRAGQRQGGVLSRQ